MAQDQVEQKRIKGRFYYDIISPFSYFYIKQRHRLEKRIDIQPVPILLGGLLRATDNRGPGEVEAKRPHTYQYCVWLAEKVKIPIYLGLSVANTFVWKQILQNQIRQRSKPILLVIQRGQKLMVHLVCPPWLLLGMPFGVSIPSIGHWII